MTPRIFPPLAVAAALVLAGCANEAPPFSNPDEGFGATDQTFVEGSADDPTSFAYFQERVGDRVLFEVDQSTLTAQARDILDLQADFLLRNMEFLAIVEGHADEQGTREYNLALGARRAASMWYAQATLAGTGSVLMTSRSASSMLT